MRIPVHRAVRGLSVGLCVVAGWLLVCGTPALALQVHQFSGSFGSEGTGTGQFKDPSGVAVNDATGDVYVVDEGNNRVERFTAAGAYLGEFDGSAAPSGAFSTPTAIAVDNSGGPLDPSAGDVYVVDSGHGVIDKFSEAGVYEGQLTEAAAGAPLGPVDGVAVDAAGELWVYQASGQIDNFSDAHANAFLASRNSPYGTSPGFAVDSADNLYVNRFYEMVAKLTSNGEALIESVDTEITKGAAVDLSNNDVYLDNVSSIAAFSAAGASIERFGSGHLTSASAVAVNASTSGPFSAWIYVTDAAADAVDLFDAVDVPAVGTGEATELQVEGSATLNGTVDPEGEAVVSCQFEYGTEASYGKTAACVPAPGSGSSPVAVHADLNGLTPGTLYHYRLVAGGAAASNPGADDTFIAPAHPRIDDESASNVASSGATLAAQINPGDRSTTYSFEYGTSASYGQTTPVPAGMLAASGLTDIAVSARTQGLEPGTAYYYRVTATNSLGTVHGSGHSFTTQSTGAEFALPDGRQYELVSPPEKHGTETRGMGSYSGGGVVQASENGERITYITLEPPEVNPPSNANAAQLLSTRGPDGWSTEDISPPYVAPTGPVVGNGTEYRAFSMDLSHGVVFPLGSAERLAPGAPAGAVLYLRNNLEGSYEPLFSEPAGNVNFEGATPDFSHVIYGSSTALTPNAGPGATSLYEWSSGGLKLVDLLPHSTVTSSDPSLDAVSRDGSHVIWNSYEPENEYPIYIRNTDTEETVRVTVSQGGPDGGRTYSVYRGSSADDSRIFLTSKFELTSNANTGSYSCSPECGRPGDDLYEYDLGTNTLTDITADHKAGDEAGADVQGVLGTSEDGSVIYFVADGALAAGASSGQPNLYVQRYSGSAWASPTFIATLAADEVDERDWRTGQDHTARVTSDGQFVAFESQASITGYDNIDAASGQPDTEVYLYDATDGQVRCVSCNATGARPVAPAEIPGLTPISIVQAIYQSRYLSSEGRLFFDTAEALVPQDVNGREDVYEYEPDGVGSCALADGCIYLISSGTGSNNSTFVDASASGADVFFNTQSQLVPQDTDHAFDIYDAHACSTAVPCYSTQPVTAPACTNVDECKPAPTPQPALFGAPASATFVGLGNPAQAKATPASSSGQAKKKTAKRPAAKHKRRRAKKRRTGKRAKKQSRQASHRSGAWKAGARKGSRGIENGRGE